MHNVLPPIDPGEHTMKTPATSISFFSCKGSASNGSGACDARADDAARRAAQSAACGAENGLRRRVRPTGLVLHARAEADNAARLVHPARYRLGRPLPPHLCDQLAHQAQHPAELGRARGLDDAIPAGRLDLPPVQQARFT